MNIKITALALSGLLGFSAENIFAQGFEDVLRYSQLSTGTTARSMAIGGATGSLGADFSGASINPASTGVYRQSEFTITPYMSFNGTNGSYIGNNTSDNNSAFKLGNLGFVFNDMKARKSGWKGFSLGLGVNKLADFNNHTTFQGNNGQSSFSDVMAYNAQTYGYTESEDPLAYLGYQGYVLGSDLRSVPYNNVIANGGTVQQTKYNESKGAVNEFVINLAGNYNDKLMLGATIGVTAYRFKRTTDFVEVDNSGNSNNDFYDFTVREKLETSGAGVNGKFGFIYAASPMFRFGASIHTPTIAGLTDYVDYNLVSDMEGNGTWSVTPENLYRSDYTIVTPMRAVISATGFFGTKGFISGDLEFVPYNAMRIKYSGTDANTANYQRVQNDYIANTFKGAVNGRLGLELRATNVLTLRAGGAYYANPYKTGVNDMGGDRLDLSLGLGFKVSKNGSLDLAYVNSSRQYKETPYYAPIAGVTFYDASIKNNRNIVALTYGVRF